MHLCLRILERVFVTKKCTQRKTLNTLYSKYQIIEILENFFQNMTCFLWIKLISYLIHLKYWYYNTPSLQLPASLAISVIFFPVQLKPLFNAILIMFLIGFPIFPYHIWPHATVIGYTSFILRDTFFQAGWKFLSIPVIWA